MKEQDFWDRPDILKKIEGSMRKLAESPSVKLWCKICKKTQSLEPIVSGETKMTLQEQMESTPCEHCGALGVVERKIIEP